MSTADRQTAQPLMIAGRPIGAGHFALIAGPCTVESLEQTLASAHAVAEAGATMFRGGAYKPRTSPYDFQGLGQEGLRLLAEARAQTGLPVVTECMDLRDLDAVLEVADVIQIGARNMQNYALLTETGRSGRPVLIKRGLSSTLDELLMAAEYVLKEGNSVGHPVRARHPHLRALLPLHPRPDRRARAQGTHRPARDRRPQPRRRAPRAGRSPVAGRRRGRGRRHHRRGAPGSRCRRICDGRQSLHAGEFPDYARRVAAAAALAGQTLAGVELEAAAVA